jgi:hypothetical protein
MVDPNAIDRERAAVYGGPPVPLAGARSVKKSRSSVAG